MAPGPVSGGCKGICTGLADTRHLSINLLRRARGNLHFDPPKLGDRPPTGELIRSSFLPLTTAAAVAATTYAAVAYRSTIATQYYSTMDGLVSSRGGDSSLPSPVFGFKSQGGDLSLIPI